MVCVSVSSVKQLRTFRCVIVSPSSEWIKPRNLLELFHEHDNDDDDDDSHKERDQ